jgi:hypothetical protein
MARDTYMSASAAQAMVVFLLLRHHVATAQLAMSLWVVADPDYWASELAYFDAPRLREAEFEVGGRHYGMYGRDWRQLSPALWLARIAAKGRAETSTLPEPGLGRPDVLVLSEADFEAASRAALRDLHEPHALAANPLLRSRLVVDRAGLDSSMEARAGALQALLREASESLRVTPRGAPLHRVLKATFLEPAPKQEAVAHGLGLSYSTYRYHLTAAVRRVVQFLWRLVLSRCVRRSASASGRSRPYQMVCSGRYFRIAVSRVTRVIPLTRHVATRKRSTGSLLSNPARSRLRIATS